MSTPVELEPSLEQLLQYLKRSRGFDFTGYKRTSLARRIGKRMHLVHAAGYAEYMDYLEVHPEEFAALFNTILINVTSFFRDAAAWNALMDTAVPELLRRKGGDAPIRVWSAGCATGEEAYSLALAFAELLGPEAFRERVKIYATDADADALGKARLATYTDRGVEGVPDALRERYFEHTSDGYTVRKDFRRQVIFGRHDLVQDAPISRVDLLVCRNVLMYFNAEAQRRILARFHFALNEGGLLFLGRAETLLSHATTFVPVDLKRRISMRVPTIGLSLRDRLLVAAQNAPAGGDDGNGVRDAVRLRDVATDAIPVAQIVVDLQGTLVLANERARQLFGLVPDDLGRPLQDLRLSYRPVELRSLIDQIGRDQRGITLRDVEFPAGNGDARWMDLHLSPVSDVAGALLGTSAVFLDVSAAKRLRENLERTTLELEAAYEELQSTNEELETTNEELQSTVEELETTNEELQSTNEELETMNEELQSTNEELTSINDEVRQRSAELNQVNAFMNSILGSMRGGVIVVDTDLHVLVWNTRATDLWGLREDEAIGRHLLALDIGLPVEQLVPAIRACLAGERASTETVLVATDRKGRAFRCRATCAPVLGAAHERTGVILVLEREAPLPDSA